MEDEIQFLGDQLLTRQINLLTATAFSPNSMLRDSSMSLTERSLSRDIFLNYHMIQAENMKLPHKQQEALKG